MQTRYIDEAFRIPGWVVDLESFRRWARSDDFPEHGRFSHLAGDLWVDLTMERVGHNRAKLAFYCTLGPLVRGESIGEFFADGMMLTQPEAGLATEPDGLFVSTEALETMRVQMREGEDALEVVGAADMVLEVVSPSSVRKDTIVLMNLYWKAGIREYWLVDPCGEELHFDLFKHGPKGYRRTPRREGWLRSDVFRRSFRLSRAETTTGTVQYTLQTRG